MALENTTTARLQPAWMRHLRAAASHLSPHGGLWLCILAVCLVNCVWVGLSTQFSFHPRWLWLVTVTASVGVLMLALRHIRSATFDRFLDAMFRFMIFALFCVLGLFRRSAGRRRDHARLSVTVPGWALRRPGER
jgi:hypothetical protein